jgi:tripartite motif-containing protein 71
VERESNSFPGLQRIADLCAIAIDASGNVYVCNSAGTVTVYPPGSSAASRTISGLSDPCYPSSLAVDAAGDVFVPEQAPYDVKEFTKTGGNTPSRSMPNSSPAVALDAAGDLYVANYSGANTGVSVYPPGTSSTPSFSFSAGMSGPFIPAFDPTGNLYILNYTAYNVTEYAPAISGSSTVAHTWGSAASMETPEGVAIDGSGNVYVANDDNGYSVTEYNSGSPTSPVRTLGAGSDVVTVVVDPLGNVYVPEYDLENVSVYPPGSSTTAIDSWSANGDYPIAIAVWP